MDPQVIGDMAGREQEHRSTEDIDFGGGQPLQKGLPPGLVGSFTGGRAVMFDGHVTDPHLYLLRQGIPALTGEPLELVEIPVYPNSVGGAGASEVVP